MVDGLGIFLLRVAPRTEHFENEQIVFIYKARIDDLAFEIGKALSDKRCGHKLVFQARKSKFLEFVDIAARSSFQPRQPYPPSPPQELRSRIRASYATP